MSESIEPVEASPSHSLKDMWLITIGHGLTHWYPATFYMLLPIIGKELGLSYTETGMIITFQYIASTISNVPGGMLVDTVGKKSLLMALSLFWVGFPYLFMNFTSTYWMLLLCISLVGIGNNLWHPTAIPTLSQRYPKRRGFVLSVHGMGANVGDALAPLAIGAMLAIFTWRQIVVINIIPGVLIALLIVILLRNSQLDSKKQKATDSEEKQGQTIKEYFSGLKGLVQNRSLVLISTSSAFRSMTQNALLTFLPLYLAHELDFSPLWVGVGLFLLQMGGFIAAPISGHLSDKWGRKKVLVTSMAMSAVILIVMAVLGKSPLFIVFIAVLGFFLYAVRPVMQAWLMEASPQKMAGTSIGILFGMQSLGQSISPLLGGIISDKFGLFAAFYFVAGTIIIANLLILFAPKEEVSSGNNQSIST
ncbi:MULTISPECIES: MFS transporter [unclassified Paenibacillus]|uniref:MFS transporter n=1 Tax=unclassified Paenibacillus TaxID=185978 RepID=UPI001AE431AD|nr:MULTISPECIES: MFS transporter [unclassified Paenibacillus]MBP1155819.1 MFS family permease [Paenibacillus sp. PvP091]MBP1168795.1 MFS family permease [Paenibacillus sp. PvR098]MBP2439823.1 MFS family permease [Paenibacillus sp. PvP052]